MESQTNGAGGYRECTHCPRPQALLCTEAASGGCQPALSSLPPAHAWKSSPYYLSSSPSPPCPSPRRAWDSQSSLAGGHMTQACGLARSASSFCGGVRCCVCSSESVHDHVCDHLQGGCTYVCLQRTTQCVCLIPSGERVHLGSVLVLAGVSLGEPTRVCVCSSTCPGCTWNVSIGVDLTPCGVREVVFPYGRRNPTAHVCVAHPHVCTHIHTEGSISAYLDLGSAVNSSVGGKYETSAAAVPGPVGNGG